MWFPTRSKLLCVIAVISIYLPLDGVRGQQKCKKGSLVNSRMVCQKKIIFEDEFNKLDYLKWRHAIHFPERPDYEFVMYDRAENNTYVKDGILHIRPSLLADARGQDFLHSGKIDLNSYPPKAPRCTKRPQSASCSWDTKKGFRIMPPVLSSKLISKMRFRYGVIEIRAQIPVGDWIYPQLELTAENSKYGKSKGTIVIALTRGNMELKYPPTDSRLDFGVKWLEAGAYAGTYNPVSTTTMIAEFKPQGWQAEFHTYRVEWNEGLISWFVDDQPLGKGKVTPPPKGYLEFANSKASPFDEEMEVVLGVGVGGIQRFPDGIENGGRPKPWKNTSPKSMLSFWKDNHHWYPTWIGEDAALKIDYVKVWSRDG